MTNFDQRNQHVITQFNAEAINIHQDILSRPVDAITLSLAQQKFSELSLDTIPEIATLPHGSRMPISPNPHFVGRMDRLQALARALKGNESVVISQVETAAATGMGGIGKTQLASEFVHRYGQYFAGGVFWLSFANANTVPTEIADCIGIVGLEIHLTLSNLLLDDRVRLVYSAWQSSLPRLLVFDGCEDEQLFDKWRPHTGGCRILITSLRPNWPSEFGMKVLPLDHLNRGASTELLCKYREDLVADDPTLDAIADQLGDLPLALHLAGSYLQRYRYNSLGEPQAYLARLRQGTPLRHPSLQTNGVTPITKHIQDVERTFALA